jgi:ammonium transporter Rh
MSGWDTERGLSKVYSEVPDLIALHDYFRLFKNMDIWFMLMLVAFLMIFIRKFEWSTCLAVLLSSVSSMVTYIFLCQKAKGMSFEALFGTQDVMIAGVVCAITVVIAIGVFLGTVKTWQYLLAGVLFSPAFMFLEFILWEWLPSVAQGPVTDPGGGILVHLFAAYWGLGVALGVKDRRAFEEPMLTSKHSVTNIWLASMLLFILWPSFVTSLLPLEQNTMASINCYFSGFGSIVSAYLTCAAVSKTHRVNPLVYTYAMLAGPVASSSTLLLATPWMSLAIGAAAGVLSTLSFTYLNAWLCGKIKTLDVMGVHNLHGVGGWISLLTGAMLAGSVVNVFAGVLTAILGLAAGFVSGLVILYSRGNMPREELFSDDAVFEGFNPDPLAEHSAITAAAE